MLVLLPLGRAIGRLRWLPFGLRDRVLRFLFPPARRTDFPFQVALGRARFAGNLDNYIDWMVYFFGSYEAGMLRFLQRLIQQLGDAPCFWDIGANCGQHTIFVAGLGARVEAFEPFAPVREKLTVNASLNKGLAINIHPVALSDSAGNAFFAPPDNENLGTGHLASAGAVSVPTMRGDDVPAPAPAIIKIDVEGHEGAVLRGLARTINASRPIILCEFSAATKALDGDLRALLPEAYHCLVLAGVETPYLTAYTGAGAGETLIMFPNERAHFVYATCHHVSPAAMA